MALRSTDTGVGERILFHKAVLFLAADQWVQGVKYTCQFVAAPPKGAVGVQENFSLTAAGEGVTSGSPDLCRRRRSETSHLDFTKSYDYFAHKATRRAPIPRDQGVKDPCIFKESSVASNTWMVIGNLEGPPWGSAQRFFVREEAYNARFSTHDAGRLRRKPGPVASNNVPIHRVTSKQQGKVNSQNRYPTIAIDRLAEAMSLTW
ncbi:predicted protein [Histoplasma capsulatum G186AR]|uniref:Uncharacterized protein n=1 Tax=Ajellomyces capsulatus (strain G186AR / H82 / ATCC MYA-2454 / RMSCC 2432) TaxID=447093 RepID=C0P0K8_AJECG|nr:uncharacterized protein HCBG_08938 [Histoplasma capsulatum G186AR]EEH02828.1 predicted protein [Histoplasma capsulatum G186AR]